MKKGLLITFEGPDGSGKTTQIELLEKYLLENKYEVLKFREPGGTKISEKIRNIILDNDNKEMCGMCEALLYAASRAQLVNQKLKPALEDGKIIICDRFVDSSIVYQGIGRELGTQRIRSINEAALDGLKPDITIMLTIPFEEGLKRKCSQKKLDRLENGGSSFHKKVFNGYLEIAKQCDKIKVVDAYRSKEKIHKDIINLIKPLLLNF